ncbi:hypothetical protein AJ80_02968 [Polytolypa hystricis UAMH7299]|uniref:Extracellular membrane protein CFEM domain-containing protein n=1 Tax=Polytolypa hystricis (strain UAMH7299) TaxID=1447883 RepID=A0A2B7YPE6_POLH7|nr:hypothetical protein AJ80_02968 [Polytolypa hystricis UAMH7299]
MFVTKSAILVAFLALCNIVLATVPPACLLAAVNTQPKPADLDTICGAKSTTVQREILKACDDDQTSAALKAFQKSCSEDGHKTSHLIPTNLRSSRTALIPVTTAGPSSTGFSTSTATGTAAGPETTETGSADDSADATATTSGSPATQTENSASSQKMDSMVIAAVVVMVGAAAVL